MALFHTLHDLILASASPRRQHFLRELGLQFTVIPAHIDETPLPGEAADAFVRRMARGKAQTVARLHPEAMVIGADTVISLEGRILGKPDSADQAMAMLRRLRNTTHQVITGYSLCRKAGELAETATSTTLVTFGAFSDQVLEAYVRGGEPMDKAGAYGIQGQGGFLVKSIKGSCSNVIGMPMYHLVAMLLRHGAITV